MADPVKPLPSDEDPDSVQQAWTEEIRRRVDKLRAGEAQFVDGDEALAQIRALIASHGG